ncbi:unnamed protein product, partial [Amoebophrya sp. A25]
NTALKRFPRRPLSRVISILPLFSPHRPKPNPSFFILVKDPQEQKDFFPLDARCDFARDVPSGNALDRGPQHSFRDLHQEARDRRQAREEYFGRAAAPTPSPSKRQRRKRRRRASTQIEPEEDPEIELVVEVKDSKPVELID